MGLDNSKLSEFRFPAFTTVSVPRERIGHVALEKLLNGVQRTSRGGTEFIIEPDLVLRDSTGPAKR